MFDHISNQTRRVLSSGHLIDAGKVDTAIPVPFQMSDLKGKWPLGLFLALMGALLGAFGDIIIGQAVLNFLKPSQLEQEREQYENYDQYDQEQIIYDEYDQEDIDGGGQYRDPLTPTQKPPDANVSRNANARGGTDLPLSQSLTISPGGSSHPSAVPSFVLNPLTRAATTMSRTQGDTTSGGTLIWATLDLTVTDQTTVSTQLNALSMDGSSTDGWEPRRKNSAKSANRRNLLMWLLGFLLTNVVEDTLSFFAMLFSPAVRSF